MHTAAGAEGGEAEGSEAEGDDGPQGATAGSKATMTPREKLAMKKARMKALFDSTYDELAGRETGKQHQVDIDRAAVEEQRRQNLAEFEAEDVGERVSYEGYRAGMYVRVELREVPCELVDRFDPHYPLVLGGLLPMEESLAFLQLRFKKHRWHNKILKTKDPIILSMGWRRFQTLPLYAMQDHNMRNRMLKYTPEHMHCIASIYGPVTPPNTGCLAILSVTDRRAVRLAVHPACAAHGVLLHTHCAHVA